MTLRYETKPRRFETSNHSFSHEPGSERVNEQASERMNTAELTSQTSSAEQVNEWAVQANGQASGPVLHKYYFVFILGCFGPTCISFESRKT